MKRKNAQMNGDMSEVQNVKPAKKKSGVLGRIIRRCSVGLARLGSFIGHGSGEVMVGFSTANRIPGDGGCFHLRCIPESQIDKAFRAVAEATEEAVLSSMLHAETTTGYSGKLRRSLTEFWPDR